MSHVLAPPPTGWSLLHTFLAILLPFTLVLGVMAGMHYYTYFATERGALESSERLNVELGQHTLGVSISNVVSDLMFLVEDIESQGLSDFGSAAKRRRIGEEFRVFARNKGVYDQIRYLDVRGMEIVRVNFNDGKPEIVSEADLQDKSNRYYAEEALKLSRGQLYLSPLDLNVEEGRIQFPETPVMRFATPVFDPEGVKRGLLVLNYLGQRLIDDFIHTTANVADHIHLLNGDGYWLRSPRREQEWGFMYGREKTFSNDFPAFWRRIQGLDEGQFKLDDRLFSFTTVKPLAKGLASIGSADREITAQTLKGMDKWIVVSLIGPERLASTPWLFMRRHLPLYLAMLVLITLGSWLFARVQVRRHQAEARSDYEKMFRHTLEDMEMLAVSLDAKGRIIFCNDHFLELTGWKRSEVIGMDWSSGFLEQDGGVLDLLRDKCDPTLFPTRHETRIRTRDGGHRLVAWANTLSCDPEGGFLGLTGIGDDITEKRATENELRKLFSAVEQSPSIVLITNRQGLIEYVNPKFTEVTGFQPEEILGENPKILKSGETSSDEYSNLWRTIRDGGEWRGEFHNRKKNGELYWESASISAIRDTRGEITHYLAVKEDITERKRLQQEVEERNRELIRNQSLAAMGRMASMIAHDLRNPLSSVKMGMQILGKHAVGNPEAQELKQISLDQIRYMEEILSDMLTFSRPDALKLEWVSIDKLLATAIGISQKRIDEYGVELTRHFQPGLPTFQGDANKLRQVFSNLIVNAAQATHGMSAPRVTVSAMLQLGPAGTGILVEICDNGSGIAPETRDKVFEPFFTTNSKGTGLGLAIVKRVVDQHQASICLDPAQPNGTCASVVLPTTMTVQDPVDDALSTQGGAA